MRYDKASLNSLRNASKKRVLRRQPIIWMNIRNYEPRVRAEDISTEPPEAGTNSSDNRAYLHQIACCVSDNRVDLEE